MTGIELYSTTAASNNSAAPNGWPEGQTPSSVNDCARQMMASIRTWYENAEWVNLGHVPTYVSGTSFTIPTNLTATYQVGRRIKLVGTTPFTKYAAIATSTYSAPNTTVTLTMDSGTIDSTISAVSLGINSVTNKSLSLSSVGVGAGTANQIPQINAGGTAFEFNYALNQGLQTVDSPTFANLDLTGRLNESKGADVASATSTPIGATTGNFIHVTGTTTITSFDTVQAGTRRIVEFTGALTLTHNATSLILPGGANITTAAGDCAMFVSEGSGNWRCVHYTKASGTAVVQHLQGTWTPAASGATVTNNATATYIKIGNLVFITFDVSWPSTADATVAQLSGLPFTIGTQGAITVAYTTSATVRTISANAGGTTLIFYNLGGTQPTNANLTTNRFIGSGCYSV